MKLISISLTNRQHREWEVVLRRKYGTRDTDLNLLARAALSEAIASEMQRSADLAERIMGSEDAPVAGGVKVTPPRYDEVYVEPR